MRKVLYHHTTPENAQAIIANGFREGVPDLLTGREGEGIVVFEETLDDAPEGSIVEVVFDVPDHKLEFFDKTAIVANDDGVRAWIFSANALNFQNRRRIYTRPDAPWPASRLKLEWRAGDWDYTLEAHWEVRRALLTKLRSNGATRRVPVDLDDAAVAEWVSFSEAERTERADMLLAKGPRDWPWSI